MTQDSLRATFDSLSMARCTTNSQYSRANTSAVLIKMQALLLKLLFRTPGTHSLTQWATAYRQLTTFLSFFFAQDLHDKHSTVLCLMPITAVAY